MPVTATIAVRDDHDRRPEIKLEALTANEMNDVGLDVIGAEFGTDDRRFRLRAGCDGRRGCQERIYGFCRKFSFGAICGMVSPPTHAVKEKRDDGDQLQRGPFPTRHDADGRPLVCRLPFEHAPRRRTHVGTWGPRGSLDHQSVGDQIQPAARGSLAPPQAAGVAQLAHGRNLY